MDTLNSIVFAILDTVRPDNMTSSDITEELIKFHIKNIRSQLIKQEANKGHSIDSYIIQSLGCIPLELADKSECCDYPTGCKILRTAVEIPSPIEMYNRQLITRFGPVSGTDRPWQQIEYERVPFEGTNKYTRNLYKWFTKNTNRRLYLLVPEDDLLHNSIEVGEISGVWEDPEELYNFKNCSTGEPCFSADSQFPVKSWMVPLIIELVIKKFVSIQAQAPIDSSNDNKTNPETTITKG